MTGAPPSGAPVWGAPPSGAPVSGGPPSGDGTGGEGLADRAATAGARGDTIATATADSTDPPLRRGEPDEVEVAAVVAALVALSAAAGPERGGGTGATDRDGAPHRRGGDPWAARGRPVALSHGVGGPWPDGSGARPITRT